MGIESITGVKEYIRRMDDSRIFTIMVTFMSTIAGSVMLAYMSFGAKAGHLLTASLMSAPAAILLSKIMMPDKEQGDTDPLENIKMEKTEKNVIEAAANGTSQGLNLTLQIGAMLIAFISIIYMLNDVVGLSGLTLERLLGYALAPFAFLIGVPMNERLMWGSCWELKRFSANFSPICN